MSPLHEMLSSQSLESSHAPPTSDGAAHAPKMHEKFPSQSLLTVQEAPAPPQVRSKEHPIDPEQSASSPQLPPISDNGKQASRIQTKSFAQSKSELNSHNASSPPQIPPLQSTRSVQSSALSQMEPGACGVLQLPLLQAGAVKGSQYDSLWQLHDVGHSEKSAQEVSLQLI